MRPLLPLFSLLLVFWLAGCEGNTTDRSADPTAVALQMPEEMPEVLPSLSDLGLWAGRFS
ncbi:hypothetical protein PAECIP111892_01908 [Paenibacillus auburnensis]|uniref:Uncharacterized protein n=1 Tax=Paenibacillus auburnensis TaxID=2905649 RepID=A0ABM9BU49_9BACL|nr:hypothetical protein [Paenibacillus auburnensis]CAH1194887.1 hypothetical protein PAECIP111892_01908 [Paenibacillus auburnensis]